MQYKYNSVAQLKLFVLIKKCVKDVYYSKKSSIHSLSFPFSLPSAENNYINSREIQYVCQAKYCILHALRIVTYARDVNNIGWFLKPFKCGVTTKIRS